MAKLVRLAAALAAMVLAAGVLVACGGDDESGGGDAKSGGSIKIGTVGPDSYDPVLFLSAQALQPLQLVYTPLITHKHESGDAGADRIPALAEALPTVTNGGKTYKMKLRQGIKYSDGSPVKASDFENTIKRLFVLAGPFSSFFSGIEGAEKFAEKPDMKGDIAGIETDDATGEITIDLVKADGKFEFALAEPYAAPTPAAKSPGKNLTKSPPPGAGPYTIKVINPRRQFELTKNPRFDLPGIPKGNVEKITGLVQSVPRMTQDVINNKLDFMTEDPTGDLLVQARQKYKSRFRQDPVPANTYYFFLNHTTEPFDKLEARQAVNYALDSRALQRIFGGRLTPTCSFLPPGVIGFEEPDPCPWGDPSGPPQIEKARELVKQSGYEGTEVTVWTNNKDPRPAIGDYYRDMLEQIGFKAKTKVLDQQVYFDTIGNTKTQAQTGFTNWSQDFPHPADFFEPLLGGKSLESTPTLNLSFKADPEIDRQIEQLTPEADPAKVADKWAALDKQVAGPEKASVAVYGSEQATSFFSERMDFEQCNGVHTVYKNDWSLFCLK